jgi:hypothetical protein
MLMTKMGAVDHHAKDGDDDDDDDDNDTFFLVLALPSS